MTYDTYEPTRQLTQCTINTSVMLKKNFVLLRQSGTFTINNTIYSLHSCLVKEILLILILVNPNSNIALEQDLSSKDLSQEKSQMVLGVSRKGSLSLHLSVRELQGNKGLL
eukprot:snap_masked-scaffold_1-processed-gene-17.23-mRNA-1 protein AED:1.00 eAED:1.00 QI:0/-1/0/0/-1/1/1/0/110